MTRANNKKEEPKKSEESLISERRKKNSWQAGPKRFQDVSVSSWLGFLQ
jgi:hypothetical protein